MLSTVSVQDGLGQDGFAFNLFTLHDRIKAIAPLRALSRIAIAVYDARSDLLHTFIHSSGGVQPLSNYDAKLSEVPSLQEVAANGAPRVIDDLGCYRPDALHTRKLLEQGYRSSYTVPLMSGGKLKGFLFFNAEEPDFFAPGVIAQLWPYAQIIALAAVIELEKIDVMQAAVSTLRQISGQRDEETGAHLQRMSRYCRLIARVLADSHALSDDYIEFLFHFSTLHDVGKVAIPDSILLKPGRLDPDEVAVMRLHVVKGREIVEMMVEEFSMGRLPQIGILFNVVAYHHENWDGSGYPYKLAGEAIPLEARITTVADVFDALTSRRPYKDGWPNEKAFEFLSASRGTKFYPPAVDALLSCREEIVTIQRQFTESGFD
ncbi:HD domain-containing phosphohydrolase [Telmatospirillum siberiense]|uniref:Phosphodiesterase n=1 Tax=Telmatospirillum siberiense TaxID=382514 RepID=A0A2N3PP58_9PROT|nr:HD domain-containing phosphohydrolase [Telmatospirillum siberiense]PKU22178.1 phosphodiesterase [Telmatospirillum siberiense]